MIVEGKTGRKRILFVGEGVTLAHVVRPLELACAMDSRKFDVVFACDSRYQHVVKGRRVRYVPVHSIGPETFLKRVYAASSLFKISELRDYIRDDLRLMAQVRPDVVVGDFRISLGISAELCGVPYLALSNAHWSPSARLPCPLPEHLLVRIFGVTIARWIMKVTLPLFFGTQARAFNRLRKSYGLSPVRGRGAPEVFTRGTRTLYLDVPQLYDLGRLSDSECYIGPVHWKPEMALPAWWDKLPKDRPVVFVTPGSSGDTEAVMRLIRAIASMNVTVMLATAGRIDRSNLPGNVYAADFLPGLQASERSDLVICNGGSGMVYQALSRGTPVLGLPKNIDQYYVMEALERKGAGRLIRSSEVSDDMIRATVGEMLTDSRYRTGARQMEFHISRMDPARELTVVIRELLGIASDEILAGESERRVPESVATIMEEASCPVEQVCN